MVGSAVELTGTGWRSSRWFDGACLGSRAEALARRRLWEAMGMYAGRHGWNVCA